MLARKPKPDMRAENERLRKALQTIYDDCKGMAQEPANGMTPGERRAWRAIAAIASNALNGI